MKDIYSRILNSRDEIVKVTVSDPYNKKSECKKIFVRPIIIKDRKVWQIEQHKGKNVYHLNVDDDGLYEYLSGDVYKNYKQICLFTVSRTVSYFIAPNGKIKCSESENAKPHKQVSQEHNRAKEYILSEGENIPALVDLGVFTNDFKIVKSKYDKFKQINRFIEIVDDAFKKSQLDEITILDFGCGKSYLTFIVYYYFVKIKGVKAKIIGYDIKPDVVRQCNAIADKYGYADLKFYVNDVSKDKLYDGKIDMVISLHACDTATDYALDYAIKNGAKYVFSVPCCQHEINLSIQKGGELDIFLKYGIVKERVSALLTDTIRAQILEDMGYSVEMIEFVDFEHSPKNIMIRATKTHAPTKSHKDEIARLIDTYKFNQTLYRLVYKD